MNGRTLSRAIQNRRPTMIGCADEDDDARRQRREAGRAGRRVRPGRTAPGAASRRGTGPARGDRRSRVRARSWSRRLPDVGLPSATESRQRWRLTLARDSRATRTGGWGRVGDGAGRRRVALAWTEGARPRPRVSLAAALPAGMASRGELLDVTLVERWPAWRIRETLVGRLPAGWRLVDLEDVWVGAPPLPGRVAAADYRIDLEGAVGPDELAAGCARLVAATTLPRSATKGDRTIDYDLRPCCSTSGRRRDGVIEVRTRIHPEYGSGRPDEVVAALARRRWGVPLAIRAIVRERLAFDMVRADLTRAEQLDLAVGRPSPRRSAGRRVAIDRIGRCAVDSTVRVPAGRRHPMSNSPMAPRASPAVDTEPLRTHVRSHRDRREAVPRRGRHRAPGRTPGRRARQHRDPGSRPARRRRRRGVDRPAPGRWRRGQRRGPPPGSAATRSSPSSTARRPAAGSRRATARS